MAIFKKPMKYGVNLKVKYRPVADCDCMMCGENKAEVVILNPNKFPDNDLSNYEDLWDVCKECNDFINWGMGKSFEAYMETHKTINGG